MKINNILIFFLAILSLSLPVSADWLQPRHDLNNSGLSENSPTTTGSLLCSYTAGWYIESNPIVSNQIIYFENADAVYAINSKTCGVVWSHAPGGGHNFAGLTLSNSVIYYTDWNHNLTALYSGNGTQIWTVRFPSTFTSTPSVDSDTVYIKNDNSILYARWLANGTSKWSESTVSWKPSTRTTAAVVNGVLYDIGDDSKVHAIYSNNGTPLWASSAFGILRSSVTYNNSVLFVGDGSNKFYAIYANNGTTKWSITTPVIGSDFIETAAAVYNGLLFVGNEDNKLYAIYENNGTVFWSYTTGNTIESDISVSADGIVYFGANDYKIYALYAQNGSLKWSYTTNDYNYAGVAIDSKGVYTGSDTKKLYVFRPPLDPDPSGYVNISSGTRMSGANVTISNATYSRSSLSNTSGYWNVIITEDGTYNYNVAKAGYVTQAGSQAFTMGGTNYNFTLACLFGLATCNPPPYNNNGFNVVNYDMQGNGFNLVNFTQIYASGANFTSTLVIPSNTTRPSSPTNGSINLNLTDNVLEVYSNGLWRYTNGTTKP